MSKQQTVAKKFDTGKPDLSLLPRVLLDRIAEAFMVGEIKYGRYNYTKGLKASQLIGAALRHICKFNDGEDYDQVDGQHHLGAAGACIAMLLRQQELGTLDDNRFKSQTTGVGTIEKDPSNFVPTSLTQAIRDNSPIIVKSGSTTTVSSDPVENPHSGPSFRKSLKIATR